MKYTSTRDRSLSVSSAQAILQGISEEGGLFVPESMPVLTHEDWLTLAGLDYTGRAVEILSRFLTDFTREELTQKVEAAYESGRFDGPPAPLSLLVEEVCLLELWHGPTCAFKDMALQLLPELLTAAAAKSGIKEEVAILVATSGDTGKAALEGFRDRPGTRVQVFYPTEGVSDMQKLQMTTQQGQNVSVVGVEGNFDDCQNGVKAIFTDPELLAKAREQGYIISSANSINWGRLVPQIVYYVSAYLDLVAGEEITMGEEINICVPTGNFGNILAAYYAKAMGLPVKMLICASNRNNVLTDFIHTGTYDKKRPFYATSSPSMDILISSNLERLLYHISGEDCGLVAQLMAALKEKGEYTLPAEMQGTLRDGFYGVFCDEAATEATIHRILERYDYLLDPHTAVAVHGAAAYREATGDSAKMLVVSTASPYKFSASVLGALGSPDFGGDDFDRLALLEQISGTPIPQPLLELKTAERRFGTVCGADAAQMAGEVLEFLK